MKTEKQNHREYQREWRKENPNKHRSYVNKYREKNKEKRSAWDKAERGVNSIVIKGLCQICNKNKAVERHHPNYDKKEKVILVCKQCHKNLHKNSPQSNAGVINQKVVPSQEDKTADTWNLSDEMKLAYSGGYFMRKHVAEFIRRLKEWFDDPVSIIQIDKLAGEKFK